MAQHDAYSFEDGMAIMALMAEGMDVDDAIAAVNPTPVAVIDIEEVGYDPSVCPECGAHVADPGAYSGLCSEHCYLNVFEDTTPHGGF